MPANQSTPEVTRALKPCPHCGSHSEFNPSVSQSQKYAEPGDAKAGTVANLAAGLVPAGWYVECDECGACGGHSDDRDEAIRLWNTRTPARGGDELREKTFAGYRLQGPDGEDYFNDTATPLSDNDRRNGWVETPLYALASTDMAGAEETFTGVEAWDELVNVDDRTSPEEYPDMCLIKRDELIDFMKRATPPVEGLTSGEKRSDADLLRLIAKDHARLAPNAYHSAETLVQIADRLDAPKATATASVREDWRDDTDNAPYDTPVLVRVGDMTFIAKLIPDAGMREDETSCDQWVAVNEGEHPPCWSGGACWDSNEDGDRSIQPYAWMALTDSGTAATIGGERAKDLAFVIAEAKRTFHVVQRTMECNADDERRWADTIEWLERLA
jgi:hypothetical protein